jgi:adenylate cyclase
LATQTPNDAATEDRQPTAAEIRAQLERILASQCFQQAGRSSTFLKFVTEQTLAGQADRLKGYTIAIEVFGRPPDFDAQNDPLVRVEAGRLRRRLFEYYAVEGQSDEVRVTLPRGSYVATWAYAPRAETVAGATEAPAPPNATRAVANTAVSRGKRRRRLRSMVAAATVLIAIGFFAARELTPPSAPPSYPTLAEALARDDRPPIVVLPFEDLSSQANVRNLADSITEETLLLLNAPELFVVATEPRAGAVRADSQARVPQGAGPAYVLSGSVRDGNDGIRVTARLVVASSGTQVWANAFDEPSSIRRSAAEQGQLARKIAAVADPYGPIFELELQRISRLPAEQLRTRDCMIKYYDYRRSFDRAAYRSAVDCFERATTADAMTADSWAGLALLLADHFGYVLGPTLADDRAALDRALEAARNSMDIDGNSMLGNLALARVQFFNREDFQRAADRALALRPNNAEVLSFIGALLVYTGETRRGLELTQRAIELVPKPPAPYYTILAMGAIREGRFEDAMAAALKIDSPTWPAGYLVVAAAAGLAGRARARALEISPRVEEGIPILLDRWRIDGGFRETLERGFAIARPPRTG